MIAALAALLGASLGVAGRRDVSSEPLYAGQQTGKPASPATTAPPGGTDARLLPANVLERIPPRASAADSGAGDFVNVAIVGTESDLALVFRAASPNASLRHLK